MGRSESFAAPLSQDLLDTQYLPRKRLTCPDRVEREYGSEKCRRMTGNRIYRLSVSLCFYAAFLFRERAVCFRWSD